MQMAAMYGSQNVDTSQKESQRNNEALAGEAWGKLFSPDPEEDDEQTLGDIKRKKYQDMVGGKTDFPTKHNRSFGRSDGNPTQNLHVGDGTGDLEAPKDGTIVYPSIFDELFAGQAQELQKRLKESLEGEDVKDTRGYLEKLYSSVKGVGGDEAAEISKKISDAKASWMGNFSSEGSSNLDIYIFDKQGDAVTRDISAGLGGATETDNAWGTLKIKPEFSALMKSHFRGDVEGIANKTDPIIPVELEMDVDGTGGIFPGNAFQSSYLPQRYRDLCCFQVVGASHKVDPTGWTTTIKGQIRVGMREKNPIDVVLTPGAQKKKKGDDKHNKTVDKLEQKRDIPKSKDKDGVDVISGEEHYQNIKKHMPGLTEKVERTPEEYEEMARQDRMIDYQDLGEGSVNQYEVKKDALIKSINDEDSQWDEGNLRAIANLIDGREESFGTQNTGLGFLQYMSENHTDRDKFPQYWSWGDAAEIELAYTNWRDAGGNSTPTGN